MCLLNGDMGGNLPASIDFAQIETQQKLYTPITFEKNSEGKALTYQAGKYYTIVQDNYKATYELAVVKAEAEKKVVAAQAEAEANRLRTQALTPMILKQQWIDKC